MTRDQPNGPGKLFIVGTPIGNMEDITLRALRALREADLIAAEDTRRTAQLLARHGIAVGRDAVHREGDSPVPKRQGEEPRAVHRVQAAQQRGPTGDNAGRPGRDPASSIENPASDHPRRLISYHEFNEAKRTPELLEKLRQGCKIALVCNAGMPTLSDPGLRLIRAVLEAQGRGAQQVGTRCAASVAAQQRVPTFLNREPRTVNPEPISLEVIPGPSAVTMALAMSGFAGSPALFYGFLPHKSGQRRKALSTLHALRFTLIFFESPYRLVKSLHDMRELLGNRPAVVARELTKKFEEILRGDLDTILKKLENRTVKGEITVVVEGNKE